ncbi:YciE/YciF ferroxidase family protein [Brevirhabdus sp.]|uniref:YciE/YciF ferroxidase family protein n=1 Tax=Brevirhabdus sp. TaxID=2004514 RepID=UPI004059869E
MAHIKSLHDLFLHTMQDIYYAEKQIEKALPKMIDKASNEMLRDGFTSHLEETHGHVERLEEAFRALGEEPKGVECEAINGIIEEAEQIAEEVEDKDVLDAALAAAAQAVEHYEIARYGTLVAWAREMGHDQCASLFEETLGEEKAADEKLTSVAESRLNKAA